MSRSPAPSLVVHRGEIRPTDAPLLSAGDGLTLHGRGAFESLAAYRGSPFLAGAHLERLARAASVLGLPFPGQAPLLEDMDLALRANRLETAPRARIRLTLSAPVDGRPNWWVEATDPPPHPPRARLVTGPFVRNELSLIAGLKTIQVADSLAAQQRARELGAEEALFLNTRNEVCEGTWSNFFGRIDGNWVTPPLTSGCLPGVTRALVLELFGEISVPVLEASISFPDLQRVDAAFLTSSLREIQPVGSIDGRLLVPAAETTQLARAYAARTAPRNVAIR